MNNQYNVGKRAQRIAELKKEVNDSWGKFRDALRTVSAELGIDTSRQTFEATEALMQKLNNRITEAVNEHALENRGRQGVSEVSDVGFYIPGQSEIITNQEAIRRSEQTLLSDEEISMWVPGFNC